MGSIQQAQELHNTKIKITQIGSKIGRQYTQEQTLIGLGLNKMHKFVILDNTNSIKGMINKVRHLLKVENINLSLENEVK